MEVVQPEGDQDFRGGIETLTRLNEDLSVPVIVKETGCGLSRSVGERIQKLGIKWVDVSGAGGTSWVAVETHRAKDRKQMLGETFWDWGIPTAASVLQLKDLGLGICATGGMRTGLDIAKAIAIGATCGGIARTFLQAHAKGGIDELRATASRVIHEIRIACLLSGARTPQELRRKPTIIGPNLGRWEKSISPPPGSP
jgi:isopentenyl-diphosphate delta-isomerase